MAKINVFVVTHKDKKMQLIDGYSLLKVGKKNSLSTDIYRDDIGENIAELNPFFCEMTAYYWIWKNCISDIVGVVHYRRFLGKQRLWTRSSKKKMANILPVFDICKDLNEVDMILPKARNFVGETNEEHFFHNHYPEGLKETRRVLERIYPDYVEVWDELLKSRKKMHLYNMLICKKEVFDAYCEWVFNILFEVFERVDYTNYSPYQSRFVGFIAERLLDTYIQKNSLLYKEYPMMFMENESVIKRAIGSILAKLGVKKIK